MNHNTLENYYKVLFSMVHHYKYLISDLENLLCFELDLYLRMIKDHNDQVKEQQEQERLRQEALARRRY